MVRLPMWIFVLAVVSVRTPTKFSGERPLQLVIESGHTASVQSVALSADRKCLITGSRDKTAILWDVSSGKKLRTFQGRIFDVWTVALSGDGKYLVTGPTDNTAILWQVSSGKKLQTFQGHTDRVKGVALSADGRSVVTGSNDGSAILWEVLTGKQRLSFQGHSSAVSSAYPLRTAKSELQSASSKIASIAYWALHRRLVRCSQFAEWSGLCCCLPKPLPSCDGGLLFVPMVCCFLA
jgi:WD40 repeat protein